MADAGEDRDELTEAFVRHRDLLFTIAYDMLGSVVDAEDVVQETWLRWRARSDRTDLGSVRNARGYLVRITTRQALNRLDALARRKESYVGPWLPEPLLIEPDVAEHAELADNLSTAMLLVLETLNPTERAVFVLREVFDFGYDEVAEAVGKSPSAVRQIVHRARRHVARRRPRESVSSTQTRAALAAFKRAVETGDIQSLVDILAPDVVALGDGGGIKRLATRPVVGVEKVTNMLELGLGQFRSRWSVRPVLANGHPGLLLELDGEVDGLLTLHVEDGLITGIHYLGNPEKLGAGRDLGTAPAVSAVVHG